MMLPAKPAVSGRIIGVEGETHEIGSVIAEIV
jgi:hypothetical protein